MTEPKRRPGRPATGKTPTRSIRVGPVWDRAAELAAQHGTTITAIITAHLEDYVMHTDTNTDTVTVTELARRVGMAQAPEKVARWVGAFTEHDPRTGQLPKRWNGQGMQATFTEAEATQLEAEWNRDAAYAEGLEYLAPDDEEGRELADRYRP